MAPALTCFSLLIFCGVVASGPAVDDKQKPILDFMSVLSGTWSNQAQIDRGSKEHDLIRGYGRPVQMRALPDKHLLLVEHVVNDRLAVLAVMDVTVDSKDKNIIRMTPYDIVNFSQFKPGQFKVEELDNMTRDQLKHHPDCVDNLVRVADGVYSGNFAICRETVSGQHPAYAVTLTCQECTSAIPQSVLARSTAMPYIFKLEGERFPLINRPAGYVSPCDKKHPGSTNSTQS